MSEQLDTSAVDPAEFASGISQATDDQLDELMAGPMREQILTEIFGRMEQHFRADSARDTEAVIHWRIKGGGAEEYDRWETVIANGACTVTHGYESEEARVTFTISGGDFLKLVTGNAAGPMLFMSGKLKISGDMMFAASAAGLFTIPKG
jgi:putative sterol carrier protein